MLHIGIPLMKNDNSLYGKITDVRDFHELNNTQLHDFNILTFALA